jgi:hypothetical protein
MAILKRLIPQERTATLTPDEPWLDLERLARVDLTSEDPAYPIELALGGAGTAGWRASEPGRQTLRFIFEQPQGIRTVHLVFREEQHQRTQEFVLKWSPREGEPPREILRQQYHFSPPGTVEQRETYTLNLEGVALFELEIIPEIGGGGTASLARLQLAA